MACFVQKTDKLKSKKYSVLNHIRQRTAENPLEEQAERKKCLVFLLEKLAKMF